MLYAGNLAPLCVVTDWGTDYSLDLEQRRKNTHAHMEPNDENQKHLVSIKVYVRSFHSGYVDTVCYH